MMKTDRILREECLLPQFDYRLRIASGITSIYSVEFL